MSLENPTLVVALILGGVLLINVAIFGMLRSGRKIDFLYYRTLINALRTARDPLKKQYDDLDELSRRVKELKAEDPGQADSP
ncbi:MAG: hypothetical protein HYZ26_10120 [Chloroflexi bacterium]|nr:hypothetical protein [Chloroflexota bacterium]